MLGRYAELRGNKAMSLYYFDLKCRGATHCDPDGTDLPDDGAAQRHAQTVARELMFGREAETRAWQLRVSDSQHEHSFSVAFANADEERLSRLPANIRETVEK
jgi:hypothetical protein